MNPDYINLSPGSGSKGYSTFSSGSEMEMSLQTPPSPKCNYAYPPVPVPVSNENAAITRQPTYEGNGTAEECLEYLLQLDRLIVKKKVEHQKDKAFPRCKTSKMYKVKDSLGRDLYIANEDTIRPFEIVIMNIIGDREVIHLSRPSACESCIFPCCLQRIDVFAPPGQLAGTVEQQWNFRTSQFSVKDAKGMVVCIIKGPTLKYSECEKYEFQVMTRNGAAEIGKIEKKWSGLLPEAFTDHDNFGVSFPINLDVKLKAVMLGACFLIHFLFFEKVQNLEQDSIQR